jgi:hypothetical protein
VGRTLRVWNSSFVSPDSAEDVFDGRNEEEDESDQEIGEDGVTVALRSPETES